ncbi:hypothetical protein FHR50_002076 [Xanthomonas arboricola]
MASATSTAPHRHGAAGQPLGGGDDVRGDTEALRRERLADPAEAGDHLVEHQHDAVAIADGAQPLQVTLRRQDHPGRSGHRLDEHGGDRGGIVQRDQPLQIVGQLGTVHRQSARIGVAPQIQRVAQVVGAGQQRAEPFAVVGQPADRHATEAHPVVRLLAADEAGALALAAQAVIGQHDLHRAIHCLRAGVGEEHMAQTGRGQGGQTLRQHERQR